MKLWLNFWAVVAGLSGVKWALAYVLFASGLEASLLLLLSGALLVGSYWMFDLARSL